MMLKNKFLFALIVLCSLVACSDDKDKNGDEIRVSNNQQLNQTVYADEITANSKVNFTTTGPWTSVIQETATKATAAAKPSWISITPDNGSKAADYELTINLETNYTGEDRAATITIVCGDSKIAITVSQKGLDKNNEKPNPHVTGVKLNKNELTLEKGESETLTAEITPSTASNKKLTWSSDNEAVATIDQEGVVTAIAPGTAVITVITEDGAKTDKCTVTVPNHALLGISLSETSLTLNKYQKSKLEVIFDPENAANKNVKWDYDSEIIDVSNDGTVTALKVGTTTITVTSVEGGFNAECAVTVNENEPNGEGSIIIKDLYSTDILFDLHYGHQSVRYDEKNNVNVVFVYFEGVADASFSNMKGSFTVPFFLPVGQNVLTPGTYACSETEELKAGTCMTFDTYNMGIKMILNQGDITVTKSGDDYTVTFDLEGYYNSDEGALTGTYTGKIISID